MQIGVRLSQDISLDEVQKFSMECQKIGFESLWFAEMAHDPFLLIPLAGKYTDRVRIGTSVALALPRSPMSIAYTSWDIQRLIGGRFVLGLGTQVKGHIERRFGIKWDSPLERLEEIIRALRAIWNCWQYGEKLDFRGKFYTLNLMTPPFNPGEIENPEIPIHIAGVNRQICRLSGKIADGIHIHPLNTPEYFREVILESVGEGLDESERKMRDFEVFLTVLTVFEEGDVERKIEEMKEVIAFYSSTRTYRGIMEFHGWGDVVEKLHRMSLKGEWRKMGGVITDEIFEKFCIVCKPGKFTREVGRRYGNHVNIVTPYIFFRGEEFWHRLG